MPEPASVAIITLGCGRNEVDSDQVAGALQAAGLAIAEEPGDAACIVVNTCTFVEQARTESVDTILQAADVAGRDGRPVPVVVIGCMAERYGAELAAALPEVAGVHGFGAYAQLPELVNAAIAGQAPAAAAAAVRARRRGLPVVSVPRPAPATAAAPAAPPTAAFPVRTVPHGVWAYLKIAGGCDRVCTFCTIPSYRGRFASRPLAELEAEARWLVTQGVRELVCVSENTTSWGKDLAGGRALQAELVAMFDRIEGLARVRLLYLQPAELQPRLLDAMAASRTVAPYYDLSLQHAAPGVIARMARSGGAERFLELIAGIRARDPLAVFRSSFIVGFPGETEADVEVLCDFLAEARIDWAGVFTYSAEDGTPSATMPEQVPAAEARARRDAVVDTAETVAADLAEGWVGSRLDVLVEERDADIAVGRSHREGPEVDGEVRICGLRAAYAGEEVPVVVTAADGVDLVAAPA